MSKEKKKPELVLEAEVPAEVPEVTTAPASSPAPRLLDVDRMALELAKQRRQTALAEAKTALAQNDNAELAYKYIILQLYMKYGLSDADAIKEDGEIVFGGALPQNQPKTQ
jgi:hypothetical protein